MTAPHEGSEERINQFYDRSGGQAWGLIQYSGKEDELHDGGLYQSWADAEKGRRENYDRDEIEEMPVSIARWDREGQFWTYDY